jgi:tetratricopeptide (TPR) repeat protein
MRNKGTGELHNLLAQIEEKDGKFVAAANEFGTAAHMDPSEDNLFDWGSELLLHRTYEPAVDVFRQATRLYPNSPRLQIGLGMTLYSRGLYEEAVKALLTAADLNPSDPRCYVFLSKAYDSSQNQAEEVIQRFRRYAEIEPSNALAQYYYAMSLWKGKRAEGSGLDLQAVEALLKKSIELDEKLPEVHVQLGNLYADQHEYAKSIPEYVRALELNPNLPDAHYRLGTDYVHVGQKDRAQDEFDVYQKLRAQHLAEVDKERAEVQQFVYSEKAAPSTKP